MSVSTTASAITLPALFISHGSPMTLLESGEFGKDIAKFAASHPRPAAIVIMSAHWESRQLEVSTGAAPGTLHDFGGFPEILYRQQYPAPGAPALAADILHRLHEHHVDAVAIPNQPYDHGVWVPLKLMYPAADIPVVAISLPSNYTAKQVYHIGQLLAPLRHQQVLFIGSGSITHNLSMLDFRPDAPERREATDFTGWFIDRLEKRNHDSYKYTEELFDWERLAPHGHLNHPTIEHLLPLYFPMGTGLHFEILHQSMQMGALAMDVYQFTES